MTIRDDYFAYVDEQFKLLRSKVKRAIPDAYSLLENDLDNLFGYMIRDENRCTEFYIVFYYDDFYQRVLRFTLDDTRFSSPDLISTISCGLVFDQMTAMGIKFDYPKYTVIRVE